MRGEARSTIDLCMARGTWLETIKDFQVAIFMARGENVTASDTSYYKSNT